MLVGSAITAAYVARLLSFIYGSSYRLVEATPHPSALPPMLALAAACVLGAPMGLVLASPLSHAATLGLVEALELEVDPVLTAYTMASIAAGLALWWAYWRIGYCTAPKGLTWLLSSGLGVDHAYTWLARSFLRLSSLLGRGPEAKLREGFLDELPDAAMLAAKGFARAHELAFFSKAAGLPLGLELRKQHPSRLLARLIDACLALSAALTIMLAASLSQPWLMALAAPFLATLAWRLGRRG